MNHLKRIQSIIREQGYRVNTFRIRQIAVEPHRIVLDFPSFIELIDFQQGGILDALALAYLNKRIEMRATLHRMGGRTKLRFYYGKWDGGFSDREKRFILQAAHARKEMGETLVMVLPEAEQSDGLISLDMPLFLDYVYIIQSVDQLDPQFGRNCKAVFPWNQKIYGELWSWRSYLLTRCITVEQGRPVWNGYCGIKLFAPGKKSIIFTSHSHQPQDVLGYSP